MRQTHFPAKLFRDEATGLQGVTPPAIEPAPEPAAKVDEPQELPKSTPAPEPAKEKHCFLVLRGHRSSTPDGTLALIRIVQEQGRYSWPAKQLVSSLLLLPLPQ